MSSDNAYIRARLVKLVRSEGPIVRRVLVRKFYASIRERVDFRIGVLISEGVFITTGIGRRGMPEKIEMSPVFSIKRCPFCLKDTL